MRMSKSTLFCWIFTFFSIYICLCNEYQQLKTIGIICEMKDDRQEKCGMVRTYCLLIRRQFLNWSVLRMLAVHGNWAVAIVLSGFQSFGNKTPLRKLKINIFVFCDQYIRFAWAATVRLVICNTYTIRTQHTDKRPRLLRPTQTNNIITRDLSIYTETFAIGCARGSHIRSGIAVAASLAESLETNFMRFAF